MRLSVPVPRLWNQKMLPWDLLLVCRFLCGIKHAQTPKMNTLIIDDAIWCRLTLATHYQLVQSIF